ncbi:hypothetical protein [Dyadobacter fanqingshengii]|uniref:Uncharacterized protein n=1 Tax=Dyadobacter fanqingshengii TaxID=2906443 RepID=A0A9X1P9C6_9BACT|nr:hypothetical protein [Dyadobacter fanqingshengii]MCF0040412.1 hypothetical protein [Dyadobacter fanqingshengii]USJ37846.1 hypothetical protein NFI81_08670 [Dyadobacter fanqingshengii]
MQNEKHILNSAINKPKTFYTIGIGLTLLFGLGHIAYAFVEYEMLDEQALWFFSGALAVLFNAGLNLLYFYECSRLNFMVAMSANFALLVFSLLLVFVIQETQTFGFAVVVIYTTVLCYIHNRYAVLIK